jgi:hypothetical protein
MTWCLIALNLGIFLYEAGASQLALERIIDVFSLTPAALVGEISARGWVPAFVTLITYQFFHADIGHFFGNMLFLWVFGDDIERALGRLRFLAFYLLCGVVGGLGVRGLRPAITDRADRRLGLRSRGRRRLRDAAALRQDHRAVLDHSACGSAPIGWSACSSSCSCGISARRRRARSPIGAISAGCWPAAVLFP